MAPRPHLSGVGLVLGTLISLLSRLLDAQRAVAAAINKDTDCAEQEVPSESSGIRQMPEVIHYERLAELMHPDAVEKLRATAATVAHYCRSSLSIVPDEMQLACLQRPANGEKHAGLAERLGYSERHFQRILADTWHQLGIDITTEGVAFAVAQGWITALDGRNSHP